MHPRAVFVVLFGALFEFAVCELGGRCVTPLAQNGSCINVFKCSAYYRILKSLPDQRSPEAVQLEEKFNCETDRPRYKHSLRITTVCCPFGEDGDDPDSVYREPPPSIAGHRNLRLLPQTSCGYPLPRAVAVVYGGIEAGLLEFPWMALISTHDGIRRDFTCGGTIVNGRYILTAAHCITHLGGRVLAGVRVGEHDYSEKWDCREAFGNITCNLPVQDFYVEKIIVHPGYRGPGTVENDIGLLRLQGSIDLSRANAKPVCLPFNRELQEMSLDFERLKLPGWGLTNKDENGNLLASGVSSPILLQIEVPIVANKRCGETYNRSVSDGVGFRQLCAGGQEGISSCLGDSGGPLLLSTPFGESDKYVQFGIVSGGAVRCGRKNAPAIYNRVAYYMDWILNQLEP